MANRKSSTSDHLKGHSVAKAELIRDYLKIYLAILEQAKGLRDVYVLDVMCGEGIYKGGRKGTAVQIAETVRHHHFSLESKNSLTIVFNDLGRSKIDSSRLKIDRVRDAVAPIDEALPDYIRFRYSAEEATTVADEWLRRTVPLISHPSRAKRLFVIDPTGYTQFDIRDVRRLLQYEGTEVFLFLPVPEMYRFVGSVDLDHALSRLAQWLWRGEPPSFRDQSDFRDRLVDQVRGRFGADVYTTPIPLAKSETDQYVLVHATRSLLGLERMVDAKWKLDPAQGGGYTPQAGQGDLFNSASGVSDSFAHELLAYVRDSPGGRTNEEVAVFALTREKRPMHAREVLAEAKKRGTIEVVDAESGERANAFYLPYKSRKKHEVIIRSTKRSG